MKLDRSSKSVDFSAKGEPMSDSEMASHLMDEVIGVRGVREPVKSMLERAYSELSKRNREWTRRRVRAVFNKEANRIEHREINEMQAVIEARKRHAVYREETARIVSMALDRKAARTSRVDQDRRSGDRRVDRS